MEKKIEKSWTLVNFMMKVLKKSEGLMKSREEMILTQAAKLEEEETKMIVCMEKAEESLRVMNESQKVIQSQRKTIEGLKNVVTEESSLNATYHEIKEANLLKTNCDIPPFLTAITKALTTQQLEIEELKEAVAGENNVADLLTGISKEISDRAGQEEAEEGNWEILRRCQEVLQEQSSSLDLLKTLASYGVTRNNSLRYKANGEGHLVSTEFCQCLPNPPDGLSTKWSAWQYDNCTSVTFDNGTSLDIGEGSKSRRRPKLNAEAWEEEVEEVACQIQSCAWIDYKELNSATRKTTYGSCSYGYCDQVSHKDTSTDWQGEGWYRITGEAGTKLADSRVAPYRCGTLASGWLTGGHPTVAQGEVARTVKFEWARDRKERKADIKVINCNSHFLYYLVESRSCYRGYCTE